MYRYLLLLLLSIFSAQSPGLAQNDNYLRNYISAGLKNNLALQSSRENLKTYDARLGQALSMFMPRLDASTRYTRAGGGRSFVFPLGSMMNPLYELAGLPTRFKDEEVPFLRTEEHDTKLEVIQPVFNLAIWNNYAMQNKRSDFGRFEYKTSELGTIYSVKDAYYNYAKCAQLVNIRTYALVLAMGALQTSKSLYQAEKSPKTDVLRAEVTASQMKQELLNSRNMLKLAANAFNNLINQEPSSHIQYDTLSMEDLLHPDLIKSFKPAMTQEEALNMGLNSRPELKQLEYGIESISSARSAITADYYPNLSLVFDYGWQGEKYDINTKNDYWQLHTMIKWNLFAGFETNLKSQELEAQMSSMNLARESAKQLIKMDVSNNYLSLISALEQFETAKIAYQSANENFNLNSLKYNEGMNNFITLLDAETALNLSREQLAISYYDILSSKAKLDKSLGVFEY